MLLDFYANHIKNVAKNTEQREVACVEYWEWRQHLC